MRGLSYDNNLSRIGNTAATVALTVAIGTTIIVSPAQNNNICYNVTKSDYSFDVKTNNLFTLASIDKNPLGYNNISLNNSKEGEVVEEMQKMRTNNLEKLDSFLLFQENWNGYGALPLSRKLISKMKGIIFALNYQPEVFPTACDSIQFEYEKENGEYLEFELFEDESIKVFKIDKYGNENTEKYKFDSEKVNEEIKNFYEC